MFTSGSGVLLQRTAGAWSEPGSRRYADPATYLYTPEQWAPRRGEYCRLVGKPPSAADALEQGKEELHAALQELETILAGGRKLSTFVETERNILAVLIAMSTNLGLARMSEACGVSYDVLAWTMEWYVREETLREADTVIVDHHYQLELAQVFGGGHELLRRPTVPRPRQDPDRPEHGHGPLEGVQDVRRRPRAPRAGPACPVTPARWRASSCPSCGSAGVTGWCRR